MKKNYLLTFLWLFIGTAFSFAHDSSVNQNHHSLKTWHIKNKEEIKASFLFLEGSQVALEDPNGKISKYPISSFSLNDQYFLFQKRSRLKD
ncbi:MAG: hypothetical protein ACK5ZX_04145 [Bacteroidota bacterium]